MDQLRAADFVRGEDVTFGGLDKPWDIWKSFSHFQRSFKPKLYLICLFLREGLINQWLLSALFLEGFICTIKQANKQTKTVQRETTGTVFRSIIWSSVSDILLWAVIFTPNIKMSECNWWLVKGYVLWHKSSLRMSSACESSQLRRHPARLRLPAPQFARNAWMVSTLSSSPVDNSFFIFRNAHTSPERLRRPCWGGHGGNLQERRRCLPTCTDHHRPVYSFKLSRGTTALEEVDELLHQQQRYNNP